MLRELHISNLAVIADAKIELAGGLNCFTGATGAGKSLVIGAIELLLGLRSPADMLRRGADEARVSGGLPARGSGDLIALAGHVTGAAARVVRTAPKLLRPVPEQRTPVERDGAVDGSPSLPSR